MDNSIKSAIINKIAKDVLLVSCLEERKLDRLDFHDVHVTRIEAALNKAFDAGFDVGFDAGFELNRRK